MTIGDDGTLSATTVLGQSRTVTPYDYLATRDEPTPTEDGEPPPF